MANEFVARKGLIVSGSTVLSGSVEADGYISASEFSGSFFGDGSGLTNVTAEITGTTTFSEQFVSQSSVLVTHNLSTTSPIVQVYDVNDEQIIPTKIKIENDQQVLVEFPSEVSGKVVIAKGGHLFLENPTAQYSQDFINETSITVLHLLDTISPFVQIYDEENEQVIPQKIKAIDSSSILVEFPTPTSGTIVVAKGGHIIDAANLSYVAQSFTNTSLVSVTHNFGTDAPIVQVYDNNGLQIIPQEIRIIDENSLEVEFPVNTSGKVAVSRGGHIIQADNVSFEQITSGSFTGSFTATQPILPSVNDQIDIGSETMRFRDLYLSGSTIYLGNVRLSESEEGTLKVLDSSQKEFKIVEVDTGSINARLGYLEIETSSIWQTLEAETSSLWNAINYHTQSIYGKLDTLESFSSSVEDTFISVNFRLDELETESGSIRTDFINFSSSIITTINELEVGEDSSTDIAALNNFTSSVDDRLDSLETESGSIRTTLNNYTSSADNRLSSLESESGSIRTTLNNYTSSADIRLNNLETESGSIRIDFNNFTGSIITAISVDGTDVVTNGNLTITGDLLVQGTQSVFNTETFVVEDNIIELNVAGAIKGGILVGDVTAPSELSGSLLWDGTNDHWIAGISGSEERIILESEFTSYTSSADTKITNLETESGSIRTELNNYTSSADGRLNSLETESGSIRTTLNNYTSSTDNRLDELETESGSIRTDFSNYTSSADNRLGFLETESGSIRTEFNNYTSSADGRITNLENFSASLDATFATDAELEAATSSIINTFNNYTSSTDLRVASLEIESGSIRTTLNNYTSSADVRLDNLETESGSIRTTFNSYTSSTDNRIDELENFSSSLDATFATDAELGAATSSIISDFTQYTASADNRLGSLETESGSIRTTLNNYTSSADNRFSSLETESGSIRTALNDFTSSIDTTIKNKLDTDGVFSGSFNDISQNPFTSSSGAISASGDLVPAANELYDLGSPSLRWKDLYLSGSTLYLGETKITRTEQGDIEFRDSQTENLRKIRVDELEIGVGESARRIKVENGAVKFVDSTNTDRTLNALGFDGVVTSSTQLLFTEIPGVPTGLVSASSQIDLTQTKNFTSGIKSRLNVEGALTSSSQLTELGFVKNDYTASTNVRLTSIENTTASFGTRLNAVEIESGSIRTTFNNYTSSINTAISVDGTDIVANGNVSVAGNLIVQGTQSIFNTEKFSVEDNIIELNVGGAVKGGILVGDITAPSVLSGSLLWDGTNDHWVAGISGSEERIILESDFTSYTSSADNKISSLETESGSIRTALNNYTSSTDNRLNNIEIESGSIRTDFTNYTSSADSRINSLEIESGSIRTTLNNYTSSADVRLEALETESGSIKTVFNNFTGSSGVVSSSAQIDHSTTSNYAANQHIDHTTVSISAGSGLTGGGTIDATRTLTLDTSSSHFTTGIKDKLNADTVVSSSAQVASMLPSGLISGSGQIAINSTTGTLDVNKGGTGQTSYTDGQLLIGNTTGNALVKATLTGTTDRIIITNGAGSITINADATSANTVNKIVARDGSGNFTAGTITATSFVETSTAKLKKNIIPLENQTETIQKLNPVRFTWKDSEQEDIGLIAEEVAELYPELVEYDENNNLIGINYSRLTVILIKTVKELITKINDK